VQFEANTLMSDCRGRKGREACKTQKGAKTIGKDQTGGDETGWLEVCKDFTSTTMGSNEKILW
jgi:hypothetical protein